MKTEITNISVKRASKVAALMGFFVSLLLVLFAAGEHLLTSLQTGRSFQQLAAISALAIPIAPLLGIVYGAAIGTGLAICYNFVAVRWGGIEVTSREITSASQRAARISITPSAIVKANT